MSMKEERGCRLHGTACLADPEAENILQRSASHANCTRHLGLCGCLPQLSTTSPHQKAAATPSSSGAVPLRWCFWCRERLWPLCTSAVYAM